MSPENPNNPLNLPMDTSIPEKKDVDYFNRLFLPEKQQTTSFACKSQREAFIVTLEQNLGKGRNIPNKEAYDSFKLLLKKYQITPNLQDIPFASINESRGITIKRVDNLFLVYDNTDNSKWISPPKLGEIENGKFTKTNELIGKWITSGSRKINNDGIPPDIRECRTEVKKEGVKEPTPTKLEQPHETHIEYKIQKGESLWKIVKGRYGLSDSPEDRRCVWNIIENLKTDIKNKDIIKDDKGKIFVGDTLFLPKVISFRYKGWKQKEFTLDEEAKK